MADVLSIPAGAEAEVRVWLSNLQATHSLPLTVTVTNYSPAASVVLSRTWQLELAGGEERWLTTTWSSPASVLPGLYRIESQVVDGFGERRESRTGLLVFPSALGRALYLPLIVK